MSDIREKLIREKVDLINTIDYAMRDFDDYLDECNETCTPPIDKLEDFIADGVISAGYRKREWIPVSERLPEKEEYTAKSKDGTEYYARLLLAYKTDIVEYEIGYYDGYKWLSEMPMRIIKDVIAWKQFEPLPGLLEGK